jgi:hypothetical protein
MIWDLTLENVASVELGFLFGYVTIISDFKSEDLHEVPANRTHLSACANVTTNAFCCAIDVYMDKALLEEVRKEVYLCKREDESGLRFDTNRLIQQPLLQAVFAESLRLRAHNMFIRTTTETINILDWVIPKDRFVIAWSTSGPLP